MHKASLPHLARHAARALVLLLLKIIYRVRIVGRENLPAASPALLIANHVSFLDALLVGAAAGPRWIRFLIFREFLARPGLGPLLRFFLTVPVSSTRAKEALKTTTQALRDGHLVCIFPEGQLTRHGLLNPLKRGFEIIARGASAPVFPIWLDNVWGSIFSFERERFFRKRPRRVPYHLGIYFGEAIDPGEASMERATDALRALSVRALDERSDLRSSLDFEIVAALRKNPGRPCLIEGDRRWSRGRTLAIAAALAERWKHLPGRTVRVAMPLGLDAALTTIALVLAGKIPRHTASGHGGAGGENADELSIDGAALRCALESLNPWATALRRLLAGWPAEWFVQRQAGAGACVALDTSYFTHRSLLAQMLQLAGTNLLGPRHVLGTSEPLHTAAGMVIGLWFPLLHGVTIAFDAPPADLRSIVWLGLPPPGITPDFTLDPRVNCLALDHLPAVVAISQPDPPRALLTSDPQVAGRTGALGRLLSGFATAFDERGQLLVRGPALPDGPKAFVATGVFAHFDQDDLLVPDQPPA